ncbi:amino acid/polyamine transporter I [Fusarium redolens]|uniref:Amino acid/polyamine transporter I n=1 Tax=Fusarium redolens TaxID=48865 RepID=A0A9P9KV12_FUSRE|nr:amino acid/polyamine transporter I [Fusarium redolens]KAH7268991.1 amino acid/polyamine transporter I [Fusarium redolens]
MDVKPTTNLDDYQLAQLGHSQSFKRNFSRWTMLGLAFAILNSWTALAASLSLALPSGGPVAVIWGLVTAGICNLSLAASLAEFLSAQPTSGGQYHWVATIAPASLKIPLSWITGWINLSGWACLVATNCSLSSTLIINIISLQNPSYEFQRWHQFLIYLGIAFIAFATNAFLHSVLPRINGLALVWSIAGFFIISITVLACAAPDYATADYVFATFINTTGWPDGIAWLLGLLQGGLGLTGFDAVAHMIEEIPNAASEGPKIMLYCQYIGISTGFLFLIVVLFVSGGIKNADTIIGSTAGPLLEIFYLATNSKVGAICLLMFPLLCLVFAAIAVMTTSSRMMFAFARDGGLPASRIWWKVHPTLGVPMNALYLNVVIVVIFGCIYLGSTVAFNAIVASSVVALGLSYGIPIALHLARGRSQLPEGAFKLPNWLGWTTNIIGLVYTIVTTVLFLFPPALPVDGTTMNYCVVAFGVIVVISAIQWVVDGRKNFEGPRITIGEHDMAERDVEE